jgi:hypothetical protein
MFVAFEGSFSEIGSYFQVTQAVHAKCSFIFMQLRALGRTANHAQLLAEDPSFPYVSASDIPLSSCSGPLRALTVAEIKEYVGLYAQAAKNAIEAGFDGIEIHGVLRVHTVFVVSVLIFSIIWLQARTATWSISSCRMYLTSARTSTAAASRTALVSRSRS